MLKNRKELTELIKLGYDIKEIINSWDPLNLLYIAPEDEYETEIKGIRNLVVNNRNMDKKILSHEIRKIFRYYCSNKYISKKDIEENVADKILEKNQKYKISCRIPNYYDIENTVFQNEKDLNMSINLHIKIREIINSWDPLKIMDISFNNEYSYEIEKIIKELLKNTTIQNLSEEINKIFKNSYNELYKIKKNGEIEIAKEILKEYENLKQL